MKSWTKQCNRPGLFMPSYCRTVPRRREVPRAHLSVDAIRQARPGQLTILVRVILKLSWVAEIS